MGLAQEKMIQRPVRIWVDTSFKRKLKVLATERNKTILDFTRDFDDFERLKQDTESDKRKRKFSDVFKIK